MKSISGKELKQAWKDFRESKKHVLLPEAPLIGGKESTAMFNIAGMQQLIPYLSGQEHPLGKRLFNIQKCVRTVDIDEVGDASHLTFFEMMGNRSLGDYFKKEAVEWSWEFLVNVLWFEPEKLAATVFEWDREVGQDNETIWYWKNIGLSEERICAMTAKDNRRSPGPVWPCWPCTEIYYWVGKEKLPKKWSTPKTDEKNWLEVWNNVFMEYYRDESGKLTKLKHHNVDTWMWFERMCKVLQWAETVYETDVFQPLINIINNVKLEGFEWGEKYSLMTYWKDLVITKRYRIFLDHIRTSCFLIRDGITPSNEWRWYILRRLIRRAFFNIRQATTESVHFFHHDNFKKDGLLKNIIMEIVDMYPDDKNLFSKKGDILKQIEKEFDVFEKTLDKWLKVLNNIIEKKTLLDWKDIFLLYDTYGFPKELTIELTWMRDENLKEFEKEMQAQQQRSRAWSKLFTKDVDWSKYIIDMPPTKFVGYETMKADKIKLLKDFVVWDQRILIFDQTPMYAESGGQMSDSGVVVLDSGEQLHITEVKKYEWVFLHFVQ